MRETGNDINVSRISELNSQPLPSPKGETRAKCRTTKCISHGGTERNAEKCKQPTLPPKGETRDGFGFPFRGRKGLTYQARKSNYHLNAIKALITLLLLLLVTIAKPQEPDYTYNGQKIICGAERLDQLLPLIKGKKIALMVNQTSIVGNTNLVDSLHTLGLNIKKIFSPEHGFRGNADAGASVKDTIDAKTGIPVISVYGKKKKPSAADLADVDIVIFDIQDVGARFYTFISSLHYLMETCAENHKELIVLDRPNPNGFWVDGPVLKKEFQSFVGIDPIPVVYGLTIGEYAQMVNGEKWLPEGEQCKLKVITCLHYDHTFKFSLPVSPSPNLPNVYAITLYPYLCFFEGTNVSVGRGTDRPFQQMGSPKTKFKGAVEFTPKSMPGAKEPPFLNQTCYGYEVYPDKHEYLFHYVLQMYKLYPDKEDFFLKSNFFDKLAGTDEIRKMIIAGKTGQEIKDFYQKDLDAFKAKRKKYLLYKDFE